MATNPSILLQSQPVQDPLSQYSRVLALKNALGQQQEQQQAIQSGQMDLAEKQRLQQADQQARGLGRLPTDDEILSIYGPAKGAPIIKSLADAKQAKATLDETKGKIASSEADYFGGLAAAVKHSGNDPKAMAFVLEQAEQAGYGQHVQQIKAMLSHDPSSLPKIIDQAIQQSPKQRELMTQAQTAQAATDNAASTKLNATTNQNRETREADEKAFQNAISDLAGNPPANPAEYNARIGKLPPAVASRILQAVPVGAYDPAKSAVSLRRMSMSGEQQTQADQAATNAEQNRKHDEIMEKIAKGHLSVAQADLELKKQQIGFETNGGVSTTAQGIADGRIDPATTRAIIRRNPGIINQVQQAFDPTGKEKWDEATGENRFNTLKEFTSTSTGKAGGQVLALNTLIHHADLYQQAAAALKNGSFRPGNAAYNAVANLFGSAPPTSASLIGRFLAGETGKVATGGVPAEGEVKGILASLGNDASPEQIANAGKTLLQIASGRATPLMERVKNAKLDKQIQVIGPDAQAILKRNGFDPETMKPAAVPSGITLQDIEAEIARRKKVK